MIQLNHSLFQGKETKQSNILHEVLFEGVCFKALQRALVRTGPCITIVTYRPGIVPEVVFKQIGVTRKTWETEKKTGGHSMRIQYVGRKTRNMPL